MHLDEGDNEEDEKDLGYSSDRGGKEWLDEDDPSEDWVNAYEKERNTGHHTPNGPLGWELHLTKEKEKEKDKVPPKSASIQIKAPKKKEAHFNGTPLTSSVQENFRGFTYSGGESVVANMAAHAMSRRANGVANGDGEGSSPGSDQGDWTTRLSEIDTNSLDGHDSIRSSKSWKSKDSYDAEEEESYITAKRRNVKFVEDEIDYGDF